VRVGGDSQLDANPGHDDSVEKSNAFLLAYRVRLTAQSLPIDGLIRCHNGAQSPRVPEYTGSRLISDDKFGTPSARAGETFK